MNVLRTDLFAAIEGRTLAREKHNPRLAILGTVRRSKEKGHRLSHFEVVRTIPRLIEVEVLVKGIFVYERKNGHPPTEQRLAVLFDRGGRKTPVVLFINSHCQADLPHLVGRHVIEHLRGVPRLKILCIWCPSVTDDGLRCVGGLSTVEGLQT